MKNFVYVQPDDVKSAVASLTQAGESAKIMAGGIDLLGELKDYIRTPDVVVNLKTIPGLNALKSGSTGLTLGPLVRLADIAENAGIRKAYTALADSAAAVGSPQIRNVGTIGGSKLPTSGRPNSSPNWA